MAFAVGIVAHDKKIGRNETYTRKPSTPSATSEPTEEGFKAWAVGRDDKPMEFGSKAERDQSYAEFEREVRSGKIDGGTGLRSGEAAKGQDIDVPETARMSVGGSVENAVPKDMREPFWSAFNTAKATIRKAITARPHFQTVRVFG